MSPDKVRLVDYEGQQLDAREVFLDCLQQYSESELLKRTEVRQVDSLFGPEDTRNPSDEHTIYYDRFAIMGPMFHVIIYRTTKDKKQNGRYDSARYALLDDERQLYQKFSIDDLIEWLESRAPDALELTVRGAYEQTALQRISPRQYN